MVAIVVPTFAIETYLAKPNQERLAALGARAHQLEGGSAIRYLASLALADDEVCFHVFEAASEVTLVEATERAAFEYDRLVEVRWVSGASEDGALEPA